MLLRRARQSAGFSSLTHSLDIQYVRDVYKLSSLSESDIDQMAVYTIRRLGTRLWLMASDISSIYFDTDFSSKLRKSYDFCIGQFW